MKKITKATFKSFIKKNRDSLLIKVKSGYDGTIDGIHHYSEGKFVPVTGRADSEHTLGIDGVWLVHGSRDYFSEYNKDGFVGIEVYNCCGSCVVAIKE